MDDDDDDDDDDQGFRGNQWSSNNLSETRVIWRISPPNTSLERPYIRCCRDPNSACFMSFKHLKQNP